MTAGSAGDEGVTPENIQLLAGRAMLQSAGRRLPAAWKMVDILLALEY